MKQGGLAASSNWRERSGASGAKGLLAAGGLYISYSNTYIYIYIIIYSIFKSIFNISIFFTLNQYS